MAKPRRQFARWHIWLGRLAGVPLLLWTLSGLVMVGPELGRRRFPPSAERKFILSNAAGGVEGQGLSD